MNRGLWLLASVLLVFLGLSIAEEARAAARVQLELVADRHAPLTAHQTWARELGQAGVRNVRIVQQRTTDRPGIQVRGTKASPLYVVTGVLDSRGEITLPDGRRYRPGQAGRIAAWLADLERHGPGDSRRRTTAFGLPQSQMTAVRADLAVPIGFSTKDKPRAEVIRKLTAGLEFPVRMDQQLLPTGEKDRVAEQLSGLSRGTGLAYVLAPAGLALVPRMSSTGLEYVVTTARGLRETWPVGWEPKKRKGDVLPGLLELPLVEIAHEPAIEVVQRAAARLKVPLLVDPAAAAKPGADLNKPVKIPRKQMTFDELLERALFQAGLCYELRTDEAGRPFLWVTTPKPSRTRQ